MFAKERVLHEREKVEGGLKRGQRKRILVKEWLALNYWVFAISELRRQIINLNENWILEQFIVVI